VRERKARERILAFGGSLRFGGDGLGLAGRCTWDEKLARSGSFQVTLAATEPG